MNLRSPAIGCCACASAAGISESCGDSERASTAARIARIGPAWATATTSAPGCAATISATAAAARSLTSAYDSPPGMRTVSGTLLTGVLPTAPV